MPGSRTHDTDHPTDPRRDLPLQHPGARRAAEIADVAVVGGGPAGLLAAQRLGAAGLTVTLVEAADRIGGRMTTERRDGFRLDRGHEPLLLNHPELARLPRPLPLLRLAGGVVLRGARRAPRVGAAGHGGRQDACDLSWLRALLTRLGGPAEARRRSVPEPTAAAALSATGVPPGIADSQVRSLLAALLGDPELAFSSRLGASRLRALVRRGLGVPEAGAAALPALLADALPEPVAIRTGTRAVAVSTTSVETARADGSGRARVRCRAVVVATGAAEAARLLPGLRVPPHRAATVLHHAVPAPLPGGPELIVDTAARGPVAHTLAVSAADPCRAPAGWELVTSVVLGPRAAEPVELLDKAARPQLAELHGVPADAWTLLAAHHDPRAVTVAPPPYAGGRRVRLLDGIYVCGDHRDAPGLAGDLASALRAADALLADAGIRRAETASPATPAT